MHRTSVEVAPQEADGRAHATTATSLPGRRFELRPALETLPRYVPGLSPEDVEPLLRGAGEAGAVKLSSNENPLGPSPRAVEAICRAAWESHRYPDPECRQLRLALARRFGVPAEQIVVANGGDNLITLLAQVMLEPGRSVAIPAVTFASYEIAAHLAGARIERVPMRGPFLDAQAIASAFAAGASVAFVCNPNNPTGTILSGDQVRSIIDAMPGGSLLVLDEAYADFVTDGSYPDGPGLVRDGAPVVVLRTFSKAYGLAGLRVGFALCPPEVARAMWSAREPFSTNRLAEAAALAALEDEAHRLRARDMVLQGREEMMRRLDAMGIGYVPSQANFLWIETPVPSSVLVPRLARLGVLVRPGEIWGQHSFIRVTIGTPAQNRRFVEALQQVLAEAGTGRHQGGSSP
ncbi:histidinol-phosphate transaminase [Carboxydochorda subterranea]|uniref:Histidinol-phosphate aminotransferase n=1 Tax=Carboxydichorda subterranea TaxID=3109565 RepID=A0ABZ1C0E9_9FIRM|nr:histidinol-phosphate transaminase [Limnochorda sp. L945t]WRP17788.1 histidinol-phosphate transaminase [Limnochorda sp. L945t]